MDPATQPATGEDRGSALVMAVFVLVLLTGVGTALLFLSQTEIRASQADVRSKAAFYIAEAGLEDARMALYNTNLDGPFDDDLATHAVDSAFDFDPAAIVATRDSDGNVTGFTGYGNDQPLVNTTSFAGGAYIAFLENDVVDAADPLVDTNDRVVVTGVGAGPDGSFEIVRAVIEYRDILPPVPPAAITILGPSPFWDDGNSTPKNYTGDDCGESGTAGAIPGFYVPSVGAIGSSAEASAEAGQLGNSNYNVNGLPEEDAIADLTDWSNEPALAAYGGNIDADWLTCTGLQDLLEGLRENSDVLCNPPAACSFHPTFPGQLVYVDGDLTLGPTDSGEGTLVVTGTLTAHGNIDWDGMWLVIGEGILTRYGGGNGLVSGVTLVADIAGPDNVYGTADDCTGPDAGFDTASYDEAGGGNSDSEYCTPNIEANTPVPPYDVVEFRQY